MPVRSPSRATLIDLASHRRRFEQALAKYVDWIMRNYKTDAQRGQQLERWLGGRLRSPTEGLGVRELLADKGSLANFKRRYPVKTSLQAGDDYAWVRIVLDEAAVKTREVEKKTRIENKGGPQPLGHMPPPGTVQYVKRDHVWGDKHSATTGRTKTGQEKIRRLASSQVAETGGSGRVRGSSSNAYVSTAAGQEMQQILARSGGNTLVLRVGHHYYTVPADCWLDDKRLGEWLGRQARHDTRLRKDLQVEGKQRLTGAGTRVSALYKIPVKMVTTVDRDPRSAMYGLSYTTKRPVPAKGKSFADYKTGAGWVGVAALKGLQHYEKWQKVRATSVIPFGKFEGQRLDVLVGSRNQYYLRVIENFRDEKIPGASRTYGQEFPGFYKAFDRRTSRLAGGEWKKGEGALAADDGVSPMDARPFAGRADQARTRAILRHRWKKVPDQETLAKLLEMKSISEQEFFALSGDISHVTQFEYGKNRDGGFSPDDVRVNPWATKTPVSWPWQLGGANTFVKGADKEAFTYPLAGSRSTEKSRQRSHFFQQQTYPSSMRWAWERAPVREADPEYHQGVWDDAADRTMFNVKVTPSKLDRKTGGTRPTQYWERHLPGTRLTGAREEATFGRSLKGIPWRVREHMHLLAQTLLTQRRKELDVALRVEDAARVVLASKEMKDLYEAPRGAPTPAEVIFGERFATGIPKVKGSARDVFGRIGDRSNRGFGIEGETLSQLPNQEPELAEGRKVPRLSYYEQYSKVTSRERFLQLEQHVTEDMTARFGGIPRTGDSPAFDALMQHRQQRWNVLALSGLKDKK